MSAVNAVNAASAAKAAATSRVVIATKAATSNAVIVTMLRARTTGNRKSSRKIAANANRNSHANRVPPISTNRYWKRPSPLWPANKAKREAETVKAASAAAAVVVANASVANSKWRPRPVRALQFRRTNKSPYPQSAKLLPPRHPLPFSARSRPNTSPILIQ